MSYKKHVYKDKSKKVTARFRLVCIRHLQSGPYHGYITNIPPGLLSAQAIAQIYIARWLIEIFFKQLNPFYNLEGFPSQKDDAVHALNYSALITLLVRQRIEQCLQQIQRNYEKHQNIGEEIVFTLLRLAAVLTCLSATLLAHMLQQAGIERQLLSPTNPLLWEAPGPNKNRDALPEILQKI